MHALRIHCTGRPGAALKPITGACPASAWDADDLTLAVWLDAGTMTSGVPDAFDITTVATLRLECRADVDTEAMLFDAKEVTSLTACTYAAFKDGTGEHAEFVMTAANMNVGSAVSSVWVSITAVLDDDTRHTFAAGELKIEHSGDSDALGAVADAVTPYAQLAFKTIAVAGQADIVADTRDDTLTIVAGSNITLTTSGDTLTITSAGGGGGGGSGDVVGPSSAVNNRVAAFDGTTGKLIKDSTFTISGTGGSTLNIGTGGTLGTAAYTASTAYAAVSGSLGQFVAAGTTSAELRGVISDETGTGALVFAGGNIGAATATSLAATGNITTSTGVLVSGTVNANTGGVEFFDALSFSSILLRPLAGGPTDDRTLYLPDETGTLATQEYVGAWAGSTNITTLGTVATGTWSATTIAVDKGGTGRTSHTAYAVLCGGMTGTGEQQSIASVGTVGQVLKSAGAGALPAFADDFYTVQATFDGGGAAISAGKLKGFYTAPMAGTIDGGSITVDTGTLTFKVWKIATGTAKPTTANNISGSGLAISTGTHKAFVSGDLSGFSSTAVAAGDIFAFEILSPSGDPTEGTVAIKIKKS